MKKKNKPKENPLVPGKGPEYVDFLHRKTHHEDRRNKRGKRDKLWRNDLNQE